MTALSYSIAGFYCKSVPMWLINSTNRIRFSVAISRCLRAPVKKKERMQCTCRECLFLWIRVRGESWRCAVCESNHIMLDPYWWYSRKRPRLTLRNFMKCIWKETCPDIGSDLKFQWESSYYMRHKHNECMHALTRQWRQGCCNGPLLAFDRIK